MNNNNNKGEEFLRKLMEEIQALEESESYNNDDSDYDDLAFEIEVLSRGVRTKPVFYD